MVAVAAIQTVSPEALAAAPEWAGAVMRILPHEFQQAFVQAPNVFMLFFSMGLAAILVILFWVLAGMGKASSAARMALRAQALRRTKDHRALVLIAAIDGGGFQLRQELKEAIEDNFGLFAFEQDVQVDVFPIQLKTLPPTAHPERRRRVAVEAAEALERSGADVIVWGKRSWGKLDLRLTTLPSYGRTHDVQDMQLAWRAGRPSELVQRALSFAVARKARPVLHRPQDYKPERIQPIVEALDKMIEASSEDHLSEGLELDVLSDFASGALSLGERGGAVKWLQKALDARQTYLDRVDRTTDPAAWGAAQQEIGRALTALGEREGARDKLEEGVARLRLAMDALRSTDSLQQAENALRALQRAENTLQQRRRVGMRWPV